MTCYPNFPVVCRGVLLFFLFSSIILIVTAVLFVVGSLGRMLVCDPLGDPSSSEVFSSLHLHLDINRHYPQGEAPTVMEIIEWASTLLCFFQFYCVFQCHYASPSSGEAYRDWRLTTNFELWVEIFCVSICFHMRIPKPCLSVCLSVRPSVCPHPEKGNHHSFVNISPTIVIDASMERFSRVLHHGNPKIWFFFQKSSKFEIWLLAKSWNHPSFVDISPTLVIETLMERSSRVLHHGNPKICFFFKVWNSKFDFWRRAEITLASSISVLH